MHRLRQPCRYVKLVRKLTRCSAIGQRRGCCHLLHPWMWDAQIAATVQVCEACQEVDEMFSDRTEARLLPSVASLDLEPEVVVGMHRLRQPRSAVQVGLGFLNLVYQESAQDANKLVKARATWWTVDDDALVESERSTSRAIRKHVTSCSNPALRLQA